MHRVVIANSECECVFQTYCNQMLVNKTKDATIQNIKKCIDLWFGVALRKSLIGIYYKQTHRWKCQLLRINSPLNREIYPVYPVSREFSKCKHIQANRNFCTLYWRHKRGINTPNSNGNPCSAEEVPVRGRRG